MTGEADGEIRSRTHVDRADGTVTFERVQDVGPILDANRQLEQQPQRGDFRHVGTVPNVLIEKWINEEGAPVLAMSAHEFARFIRRKLNDPDYRYLRTAPKLIV
ncbi:hypothetical protein [Bauldia sp.]|uniref:hypothetical protein n=1 Tax=Bauldia sp. TaxID=2575872 RepID=UPI003BAA757D